MHRAISEGDAETGVTIIRLVRKLDAGPMALVERTPIAPDETRGSLEGRLAAIGARLLVETLARAEAGTLKTTDQDDAAATYAAMFKDEDRELKWTEPADRLNRLVRALLPVPGAWFRLGDERVKVLSSRPGGPAVGDAGTIMPKDATGARAVACGTGSLVPVEVQPEGKNRMAFEAFLAGRRLAEGGRLTD